MNAYAYRRELTRAYQRSTPEERALAIAYLAGQYRDICGSSPYFARNITERKYVSANLRAVLAFDRRMILLRAGRADIANAWSREAEHVIGERK